MDTGDEKKLVELLKSGKIKPDQLNKEGQTPLMIAIDNSFSIEIVD